MHVSTRMYQFSTIFPRMVIQPLRTYAQLVCRPQITRSNIKTPCICQWYISSTTPYVLLIYLLSNIQYTVPLYKISENGNRAPARISATMHNMRNSADSLKSHGITLKWLVHVNNTSSLQYHIFHYFIYYHVFNTQSLWIGFPKMVIEPLRT